MAKNRKKDLSMVNLAVKVSFDGSKINPTKVKKITKLLSSYPRVRAIYFISQYLKGLKRVLAQNELVLELPAKTSPAEIKAITSKLNSKWVVTNVTTQINPGLIGGFKVKIGDYLIDASVSRQIAEIGRVIYG